MYKKITVLFPTHNGWNDTKQCLLSLQNVNYPKNQLEIIVIDNNSSDSTPDHIQKMFPKVKLIQQVSNLGYARAANIGVAKSTGTYIMFGNNDVVYEKNFFRNMVALAESDPRIGVLGGKAYFKDQPDQIGFGGLRINPYLGYHIYDLTNLNQIRSCELVPAGGFFVRKNILKSVGLLDEGFFLFFEDVDFCLRVMRHGYKILYNPHAIYYHGTGKTVQRENSQEMMYNGYKSKWRCLLKNATLSQIIFSFLVQCCITIHVENLRFSLKTYKPFIKALYWNLLHLLETLQIREKDIR